MRFGILCYIFLHVDCALLFCVAFLRVWNALWYFVLNFIACGTRFGISCCISRHVERALVFCAILFCVWNALLYFALYFLCVERALVFCVIFYCVWNALWYIVFYIFLLLSSFCVLFYLPCFPLIFFPRFFETILDIYVLVFVEFCSIFFRVWNALYYCGISCYIFSACGTRSGIVEFHVIFSYAFIFIYLNLS